VTEAAFGQRRKMLRQSLKKVFQRPEDILRNLDLDPTQRAETLAPQDFLRLAETFSRP
jgi:16S rRNA (adenine1518-N6/adenine1519-N6)-dimethyltransferase